MDITIYLYHVIINLSTSSAKLPLFSKHVLPKIPGRAAALIWNLVSCTPWDEMKYFWSEREYRSGYMFGQSINLEYSFYLIMLYYSKCLQLNPYTHLLPKKKIWNYNSLVGIAGHAEIDMEFSSMLRGCSKIISLTQRG